MGKENQQQIQQQQYPPLQQQANLKQALVAGALAGIAVDSFLFPLGIVFLPVRHFVTSTPISNFL